MTLTVKRQKNNWLTKQSIERYPLPFPKIGLFQKKAKGGGYGISRGIEEIESGFSWG